MSHLTEVKLKIKDVSALAEAAEKLGLDFRENQTTYNWYGVAVGDTSEGARIAKERGKENLGTCLHAMRRKGAGRGEYEIGVVDAKDGDGFELLFDTWGPGAQLASAVGGADAPALKREYAVAVASKRAKVQLPGWQMNRKDLPGGRVQLRFRKR